MAVVDRALTGRKETKNKGASVDWVARARALAPKIAEAAPETERNGKVSDAVMAAMHEAGLFRMALPGWLDGGEATPLDMSKVCEVVSAADASTAWCQGQALGCCFAAGYVDRAVAKDIYGPPDAVVAWGPPGRAKAIAVEGGYQVTGEWRFASGSRHATWMGSHCRIYEDEDTPRTGPNGGPVVRTMIYPKSSATMIDVWQVLGLRGTGSDNYRVEDLFVPAGYSYTRDSAEERCDPSPLFRIPLLTFYGMVFGGVALGIARAMLDEFIALAETKVEGGSTDIMRNNAVVQSEVAQCEAKLASSRAFLHDMIEETWETAVAAEPFPLMQRARLRTSITWAMNQAREVANYAYHISGTNGIFEANAFERRFRDMNTVAQQGQGHKSNFEEAGQAFLGAPLRGHRL